MQNPKKSVRLSEYIIPHRYKIMIRPDLEQFSFTGEETISLEIKKSTDEITLHADELGIATAQFIKEKNKFEPENIFYDKETETVKFKFPKRLPEGQAQFNLKFSGILNDKLRGFYRSKHIIEGEQRYLATTQFESTDARRAFPCIDEPNRKAIFDVTLMVPANTVAISNTIPTQILEHESGYQLVEFAPTPKMSTYLLAFIVGDFEYIETKTKRGVQVRVFVTPGKKAQAKFALETAKRTLEFFEQYFKIKYPLPVLDLIAIPDFQSGAMENWGAVTYRETYILVDEKESSTINKQWVALVIAHELAHQWFGNLVTMQWWTHLWLNEGFASYIEYLAVDKLFPKWDIWTQFVYLDQGSALTLDALNSTHPIEVEVHDPAEITEIFDVVSYSKGASIIRMLAEYLGYKAFRDGLRRYLNKHKFANATTADLWKAFEEVSGKNVTKLMENWTSKAGYPLLTILEGKDALKVVQSRFYSSAKSARQSKDRTLWSVPIQVKAELGNPSAPLRARGKSLLMDKKMIRLKKPQGGWIKLNSGETSFVRVDYPAKYLHLLKSAIEQKKLDPRDRLGVIRDAFVLAEANKLATHEALRTCLDYIGEDDYSVWAEIASNIHSVAKLIYDESFYLSYQKFGKELFFRVAQTLGWEKKDKEKHTDALLRSLALYGLGTYGDSETVNYARELFNNYIVIPAKAGIYTNRDLNGSRVKPGMTEKGELEADLRGVVYNLVAENGNEGDYEELLKLYRKSQMQEEQMRVSKALGSFRKKPLLQRTLELAISEEVRAQDTIFVIAYVWGNPLGRQLAWEFVKKNWKILSERYEGGHLLPRLLEPAKVMNKKEDAQDIEEFFQKNPAPEAERTIRQVVEQINSNADWLERDKKGVKKFLKEWTS